MIVRFDGPLYVIDPNVPIVFAEIINAIAGADNPADVHRQILKLCKHSSRYTPADFFKWGFNNTNLWLQQRMAYRSYNFFNERLLTVLDYMPAKNLPVNN